MGGGTHICLPIKNKPLNLYQLFFELVFLLLHRIIFLARFSYASTDGLRELEDVQIHEDLVANDLENGKIFGNN